MSQNVSTYPKLHMIGLARKLFGKVHYYIWKWISTNKLANNNTVAGALWHYTNTF